MAYYDPNAAIKQHPNWFAISVSIQLSFWAVSIGTMQYIKGFIFLAIVGLTIATPITESDAAPSYQYLYQVSLYSVENNEHFCSGSILSDQLILTTADCVKARATADFAVKYGTPRLSAEGKTITVEKVVLHPEYKADTLENNIALVFTSAKMDLKKGVAETVGLPGSKANMGDHGFVSGWGGTKVSNFQCLRLKNCFNASEVFCTI